MAFSFMDWEVPVVAPYLPIPIIHSPPPLVELKTDKVMAEKTYPVTSSKMSRIYNVACADWKQKIQDIMIEHGMLFNSVGSLPETVVQRMFAAATEEQKKVLREVFPTFSRTPKNLLEDKERDELVRTVRRFSTEAFGSDLNCQVASSWATDVGHSELKFKSIGFSKKLMNITIHENSDVLVLEFREKE